MRALKKNVHPDELRRFVRIAVSNDEIEEMILRSLLDGLSYDRLEMQMNLDGKYPACCRNTFYSLRRRILVMLQEKDEDAKMVQMRSRSLL